MSTSLFPIIFAIQVLLLVVMTTNISAQEYDFAIDDGLAAVRDAGSAITSSIPNWYPYNYTTLSATRDDVIEDRDMFGSLGGNNVTITQDGVQHSIEYNSTNAGSNFTFGTSATHPFIFLMDLDDNILESTFGQFTIQSNLPTNSTILSEVRGNVTSGIYKLNYWVYQATSLSRPSIAQVYFTLSHAENRRSLNEENPQIINNSSDQKLDVTFNFSSRDVTDDSVIIVAGYTLFSKINGNIFNGNDLKEPLRILLRALSSSFHICATDPCLNGNCSNDGGNYICTCDDGWTGVNCDVDIDECMSNPCVNGNCTDGNNSYFCTCNPGWGRTNCDIYLLNYTLLCEPEMMTFYVQNQYYINQGIRLKDLHLNDFSCNGGVDLKFPDAWMFNITSLPSCGNILTSNSTHLIYSNTLTNSITGDDLYIGTTGFFFPFSCAYKRRIDYVSLFTSNFNLLNNIINVTSITGHGLFRVTMNHYTDRNFNKVAKQFEYNEDELVYVKLKLDTTEPTLNLVIERCWVTPSSNLTDSKAFDFIFDGCSYDTGRVDVIRSGNGSEAMFTSPLFAYKNYNVTYMHCSIVICSSAGDQSCVPTCDDRKKRSAGDDHVTRSKREVDMYYIKEILSIGPFYKKKEQPIQPKEEEKPPFQNAIVVTMVVGIATVFGISALCCLVICYCLRRKYNRKRCAEIAMEYKTSFYNQTFFK